MQALDNQKTDNPLITKLLDKLSDICENDVVFCWLPSHIGIRGNEEADKAAKEALSLDVLPFKVPFNDFKPLINDFIQDVWLRSWNDPANYSLLGLIQVNGSRHHGQVGERKLFWPV